MKKLLLLLSFFTFSNSYAEDLKVNFSTKIVNKKQVGHSDGHDTKGFLGTNIYSANIEVVVNEQIILIPTLYTINDRKEETVHVESEKAKHTEESLIKAGLTKQAIIEKMTYKYKNFSWF